jgi:hypothetical protein
MHPKIQGSAAFGESFANVMSAVFVGNVSKHLILARVFSKARR